MNQQVKNIRETQTLLPRQALKAADRLRTPSESSQPNSVVDANSENEKSPESSIDRLIVRLDCTQSARVTARIVLAAEFASVRRGIMAGANETLSLEERLAGVHQARRGLKRLQAMRNLLQSGFPHGRELARSAIRAAKASLAETRQRDALASLLEELCALRGQPLTLSADGTAHASQVAPSAKVICDALAFVASVERTMHLSSGAPLDWYEVTQQFSKRWRNARTLAHRPWLGLGESDLHDLRKKFQRLADQMAVLGDCIASRRYANRDRLRSAAENLGRARDLALLVDKIEGTTAEGRALAKRALELRSKAIRSARQQSRLALTATASQMSRMMNQRIDRS